MEAAVLYPANVNENSMKFIDEINSILKEKGGMVLQKFELINENIQNLIYKIVLPNHIIATISSEEYTDGDSFKDVKVVLYDQKMNPTKVRRMNYNSPKSLDIAIEWVLNGRV